MIRRSLFAWPSGCALLGCLSALLATPAVAQNVAYPADAGVIDVVAEFNVISLENKPASWTQVQLATHNHTQLQLAVDTYRGPRGYRTLYLRNGTYLINDSIEFEDPEYRAEINAYYDSIGKTNNRFTDATLTLQGQSRDGTIIKLGDSDTDFQAGDPEKPVIATLWEGYSNHVMEVYIRNLTIDTGVGNPAAIGVTFIAHNSGGLMDVTVRSGDGQGRAGVGMFKYGPVGPALVKNVRVEGFDYGIDINNNLYHMTFENIELVDQKVAGLRNNGIGIAVRKLTTSLDGPAVVNEGTASIAVIVDSTFDRKGTGNSGPAVVNNGGEVYLLRVNTQDYALALDNGSNDIPGGYVAEHVTGETFGNFRNADFPHLQVEETPELPWDSLDKWVSVEAFGADALDSGDDAAGIQAAIDSMAPGGSNYGKTTLYFPRRVVGTSFEDHFKTRQYKISSTIRIHGGVKRITGVKSDMVSTGALDTNGEPVFRIEDTEHDTLFIDGIVHRRNGVPPANYIFENTSSKTVVMRDMQLYGNYGYTDASAGGGDLFIENIAHSFFAGDPLPYPGWVFRNRNVWARQFDPEQFSPHAVNDGGKLWVLGWKSEDGPSRYEGVLARTTGGGVTEILGGYQFHGGGTMFENDRSTMLVAGFYNSVGTQTGKVLDYTVAFHERQVGSGWQDVEYADLPLRTQGNDTRRWIPLYYGVRTAPTNHWTFDSDVLDQAIGSANEVDGVADAGASIDTSNANVGGGSLLLSGSNSGVLVNGQPLKDRVDTYTISLWFRPDTLTGKQTLFEEGGSWNGIAIGLDGSTLRARLKNGGNILDLSTTGVQQNTWQFAALTVQDGQAKLYLGDPTSADDTQTASSDFSVGSHANPAAIGRTESSDCFGDGGNTGNRLFTGRLDDVRIYDGLALSASLLQDVYDLGISAKFAVKINFQPADAPTVPGYLVDAGDSLADRGNGYTYGWSVAGTGPARDRDRNSDQRYDTLIHMQVGGDKTWSIDVPNGTYDVTVVCGDPSFTDQINNLRVDSTTNQLNDPDGGDNFDEYMISGVVVDDGRISIWPAWNASNAKINFVEIQQQ